jgi:hypothetical protein
MSADAPLPRQTRSSSATRYQAVRRPRLHEGYLQRLLIWEAVERLGTVDRSELLTELRGTRYSRPDGGPLDEAYCRIELTDMTKRGHLQRVRH